MKMVKGLLLGTAAGLVAMTGAQAADLPVKAAPVQYVKICSLYGAGFYYIPGTDTCLKVGGWVRAEYNINAGGSFNPIINGVNAEHNRNSNEINSRARGIITLDAREQTEYGTLRAYISGGWQSDNGNTPTAATAVYRFFIQLAGFTAGYTQGFFDFFPTKYSAQTNIVGSDSSGNGTTVFAYTAQFGGGLSATVSLEEANFRRNLVVNTASIAISGTPPVLGGFSPTSGFSNSYAASQWPDVVANVRVDQAWGSAQVMGALHQVNANYFDPKNEGLGHPDDKVGWAVGAGVTVNLPMLGKGDSFSIQANYADGATRYNFTGINNAGFAVYDGNSVGFGLASDAVYDGKAGTGLELTKSWSIVAGIDHHWVPNLVTSLYGQYGKVDYGDAATSLIAIALGSTINGAGVGSIDPDFTFWQVGSRTVWTPVKNLDLSVDVMYNHLDSSYDGAVFNLSPGGGKPAGNYSLTSQDWWQGIVRVQRNFYP